MRQPKIPSASLYGVDKDFSANREPWERDSLLTLSLLINSAYFFLECVFILKMEQQQFRLVVLHNRKVLTDTLYDTARGARIAFSKLYKHKAWKEGVKPEWTHFYNPETRWLSQKMNPSIVLTKSDQDSRSH